MTTHSKIYLTLKGLKTELKQMTKVAPEQDVRGMAIPVLDAVLEEAKGFLDANDPVVVRVESVLSAESFGAEEGVRAVDLLVVVTILLDRIGHPPTMDVSISHEL
jgi:hypothetical protein